MKKITKIEPSDLSGALRKRRVAAYCRVSTGAEDQLISLETQKSHYEDYIGSNPEWEYAGLYYDEGITGTSQEKRPALQQMIRDCEDGKIDYILTKSLSRFARNTTDCLSIVRKLLDLGIPIFFEKENLDTGEMESELLLSIMSRLAESESVTMAENNKWSIQHRYENGTFKIGYAPYGYNVTDGVFSINEEEAKWVRFVFAEALAGKSTHKIAQDLNEKKVPARRGKSWHASTVACMLRNEKYVGDCLFQKTYSDFQFKRHTNRGERDQYYMQDHHEAIVSREDFESAQKLIQQRALEKGIKKGDPKYTKRFPFTKKIVCGECGSTFKRRINGFGESKYPAWVCKQHLEDVGSCSMKYIHEEAVEQAFITMMNKLVFARKEMLQNLLDGVRGATYKGNLLKISEIDSRIESNTERRETLTTLMTKGYIDPALFAKESNDLSQEWDQLLAEKDRLVQEINGNMKKTEAIADILKYTARMEIKREFDPELVNRFLDHITVHSRQEITFHLKCGLNLRERID